MGPPLVQQSEMRAPILVATLMLSFGAGCPEEIPPPRVIEEPAVATPAAAPAGPSLATVAVGAYDPAAPPDAPQLYCNGGCSWSGPQGCDQADADTFCRLKTGRPDTYAVRFRVEKALPTGGFPCAMPSYGHSLGPWPEGGFADVRYQDTSILQNHGAGDVIADVECGVAPKVAR